MPPPFPARRALTFFNDPFDAPAFHTKVFNQPLETETAFTALALFNMLRSPLEATTDMVAHSLSAHVSTNRVQAFLSQEQTKKYSNLTTDAGEIGFRGATLTHASTADTTAGTAADEGGFALRNLDLTFPKGELSLVAGPVGSGKTTLLLSLLGETALVKGQVLMHEHYARETAPLDAHGLSQTVAFCSQQPWLVGASVKENITFGSAWCVLSSCLLQPPSLIRPFVPTPAGTSAATSRRSRRASSSATSRSLSSATRPRSARRARPARAARRRASRSPAPSTRARPPSSCASSRPLCLTAPARAAI